MSLDKAYEKAYDKSVTMKQDTFTVSEARKNLYDLVDAVDNQLRSFLIVHKGQPAAVLMPVDEVESWQETLEIMSDKKLVKSIKRGLEDIKAGRVIPLEEVMKKLELNEDTTVNPGRKRSKKNS